MTNDFDQMAQDAINAIAEKIKNLKTLNIIVAGKTGVGKSTLINSVFCAKLATEGLGKPVTDHMSQIIKKGVPLTIYDTRGFELGKEIQQQVKQEILETIQKGLAARDVNSMIHCIWYCINTTSNRVEPEEIEWLRELSKENQTTQIPIVIVLTQSISKKNADAMRRIILNENLDVVQVVPVLAEDYEIDDGYVIRSFGLDVLVRVMGEALPEELIDTLNHVQIACLAEKQKQAQKAVKAATVAASAACTVPVPLADSAMIIPTQLGMIASITVIFGFDVNKSILIAFLSSTLGTGGATVLGKTVVSNLLKFIPGVGSVAGGAISAATAGVITAALGAAYIGIMTMVYNGEMSIDDLGTKKGKDRMANLFVQELKKKR